MKKQIAAINTDSTNRFSASKRQLLTSAAVGAALAILSSIFGCSSPSSSAAAESNGAPQPKAALQMKDARPTAVINPLKVPSEGSIPVAFLISDGVDPIDVFGPWEVFHQTAGSVSFRPYSVGETMKPITVMGGGMKLTPTTPSPTRRYPRFSLSQPSRMEARRCWPTFARPPKLLT